MEHVNGRSAPTGSRGSIRHEMLNVARVLVQSGCDDVLLSRQAVLDFQVKAKHSGS
jgi:hypothetical protein